MRESIYIKKQIWELEKLRNNPKIANFWSQILVFQIKKILEIF